MSGPTALLACSAPAHAEASHSQFIDAGCVGNAAADLLCGKGSDSRRQVAELTATPMLAWLWDQLVGQQQQQVRWQIDHGDGGSRCGSVLLLTTELCC